MTRSYVSLSHVFCFWIFESRIETRWRNTIHFTIDFGLGLISWLSSLMQMCWCARWVSAEICRVQRVFNPRCVTSQRDDEAGGGICQRVIGWQQAQIQPALVNFPQLDDKLKPPVWAPLLENNCLLRFPFNTVWNGLFRNTQIKIPFWKRHWDRRVRKQNRKWVAPLGTHDLQPRLLCRSLQKFCCSVLIMPDLGINHAFYILMHLNAF